MFAQLAENCYSCHFSLVQLLLVYSVKSCGYLSGPSLIISSGDVSCCVAYRSSRHSGGASCFLGSLWSWLTSTQVEQVSSSPGPHVQPLVLIFLGLDKPLVQWSRLHPMPPLSTSLIFLTVCPRTQGSSLGREWTPWRLRWLPVAHLSRASPSHCGDPCAMLLWCHAESGIS